MHAKGRSIQFKGLGFLTLRDFSGRAKLQKEHSDGHMYMPGKEPLTANC